MKRMLFTVLFATLGVLVASAETWDLTDLRIVLPARPNASQRAGAAELVTHLELLTGKKPSAGAHELVFAVPPGAEEAQPFEARCRIRNGKVWFWGDDSGSGAYCHNGSLFAVYAFLNRILGIDWAWPGSDGIVFTRRQTADVPSVWDDVYSPPLKQTLIRNYGAVKGMLEREWAVPPPLRVTEEVLRARSADIAQWYRRRRLLSREKIPYGHAFLDWQDRFLKSHPEYLCQPKADDPTRGMASDRNGFKYGKLCISNDAVADQIVADWEKRGKPPYINICENDGRSYCRCANCMKLDAPLTPDEPFDRHKTDRYVNFWNRVAARAVAKRPDVVLSAYIYSDYRLPPRREKVAYPDNMYFGIVPSLTDNYRADCTAWKNVGMKHFFLRPNFHCYHGVLPRGVERAVYENFQTSLEFGIVGVDYDGYPGRYETQPEYYVAARMVVDPKASFESIMRDFCAAYGEGADAAWEYYARLRARGERQLEQLRADKSSVPTDGTYDSRTLIHTVAELEEDRRFLKAELAKIRFASPEAEQRFRNLVLRAGHYILTARFYEAARGTDQEARDAAGFLLNAFRIKFADRLPDYYGYLYGNQFACGELWAWRKSAASRAVIDDIVVDGKGVTAGWSCSFDHGRYGWWTKRHESVALTNDTLAVTNGAIRIPGDIPGAIALSCSVRVTPGATYDLSADFRVEGAARQAVLRVLYPKGSTGATKKAEARTFGDLGADWSTRTFTFTVPDDVTQVMLYVYAPTTKAADAVWCDNTRFVRK